jgi:hypothetical protein
MEGRTACIESHLRIVKSNRIKYILQSRTNSSLYREPEKLLPHTALNSLRCQQGSMSMEKGMIPQKHGMYKLRKAVKLIKPSKVRNSHEPDLASWYPCIVVSQSEYPCCFRRTPFRCDKNDLTFMTTPYNATTKPLFGKKKQKSSSLNTVLYGKVRAKVVYGYSQISGCLTLQRQTTHIIVLLNTCSLVVGDKK